MTDKVGVVAPPPGVTADFDYSHPWKFKSALIIVAVGLTLSTLFLAMRIWTRVRILSKFGWDDGGYIYGGSGIHLWNVTEPMFNYFQKIILVAAVIYVPCLAFAKVGLIILYHRIMNRQPGYLWTLYIISAIVCGYSIAIIFALIFACTPIQKGWDSSITTGHCVNRSGLYIATAALNIVSDLALIVVPIPLVMGLQMPRVQKYGLMAMFIVGCATFITSILRLQTLIPYLTATDTTYQIAPPQMWIYIEANLIIICPCLPFLRQFLRRYSPAWIGEATSSGRRYYKDYSTGTSIPRSRRKPGLTQLQDEIALAENAESTHSQSYIVKEIQWQVTEERLDSQTEQEPGIELFQRIPRHSNGEESL
ncbi:hypothetical protein N7466_000508 [Penicillium verhagenii]|uniref:uncharacterized protein n=1 Tax=Penicillium verhagenii TaxID=1562060 RepID=UPI002544D539|nr:uncharacterized protein N7466_000508 [Penicillium verhagenii]KAJ5947493.1 hypothetical protein N7466_000508 [Penicillium verhagenii]